MSSRSAKNGLAEFWLDGWHGESMENDGSLGWPSGGVSRGHPDHGPG